MRIIIIFLLVKSLSIDAFAQKTEVDSLFMSLTRSIERSISKGHDHSACKGFQSAMFSILVSFSKDGLVENVLFSDTPNCFTDHQDRIKSELVLNLNRKYNQRLSDKSILAVAYIMQNERSKLAENNIPRNWESLFRSIDFSLTKEKEILYVIPVGIYLIQRVK